jgi:hypothetical protein
MKVITRRSDATLARSIASILAVICWGALLLQLWLTLSTGHAIGQSTIRTLTNYFSFFTILNNLFVAIMFTWTALTPHGPPPGLRTAIAVYIAVVGIGYSLLLRHIWDPQGLQKLADILLHDVIPLAYVLFWIVFFRKRTTLPWRSAFVWLIWPLIYLIYSMVRGSIVGWYPYHFLDPAAFGYPRVLSTIAGFIMAFLALGLAAVSLTRRDSPQAPPD